MILQSDIITVSWFCQSTVLKGQISLSQNACSLFQTIRVRHVATLTDVCGLGWGVCSSEEDCSDEELMLLQGRRHQKERDTRTANRWGQRDIICDSWTHFVFSVGVLFCLYVLYVNDIVFIHVFLIRREELYAETGHHTSKLQHRNR